MLLHLEFVFVCLLSPYPHSSGETGLYQAICTDLVLFAAKYINFLVDKLSLRAYEP